MAERPDAGAINADRIWAGSGKGSMTLKEAADKRLQVQNANGTIDTLNPNSAAV